MTVEIPIWIVLLFAFCLDWTVGDPRWLPHPIRWMGKAVTTLEPRFRNLPIRTTFSGGLFTCLLVSGTWVSTYFTLKLCTWIHPILAVLLETVLIFFALSIRSLDSTARMVAKALKNGKLSEARNWVGHLIGRDIHKLDASAVARGAVESVAENFVDGVVSPLFFAAIGGAPAAMAYKMINTLDSMVGYKNERYVQFGKASARLDDVINYIPARIAVLFIALSAQMALRTGWSALRTAAQQGHQHTSPNAGYSEAAFAGALGVWLNGPNYYGGVIVSKPVIGIGLGETTPGHINRACDLMLLASLLCLASFCMCIGIVNLF